MGWLNEVVLGCCLLCIWVLPWLCVLPTHHHNCDCQPSSTRPRAVGGGSILTAMSTLAVRAGQCYFWFFFGWPPYDCHVSQNGYVYACRFNLASIRNVQENVLAPFYTFQNALRLALQKTRDKWDLSSLKSVCMNTFSMLQQKKCFFFWWYEFNIT